MIKTFAYFLLTLALPIQALAQFTITGKVLNKADKKPVENVSVFLSNATIGDKTAADGSFTLHNVKPGKYDLVVTDIAFETYSQPVVVEAKNIALPGIMISPQTRALNEVVIKYHADPDRSRYLDWFTDAFIGTSDRAKDCKIVNPEILDLRYDREKQILTASSADFLVIENRALGYRIKYLLTDFWMRDSLSSQQMKYRGYTLFEEMKGNAGQMARWQRAREVVYANSSMHFFRAAIADKLDENNFSVKKLATIQNPDRPPDSLIAARLQYFKSPGHNNRDSLAFWSRKEKLPRTYRKLLPDTLRKRDIIARAAGRNVYALFCDSCDLVVAYNRNHHFRIDDHFQYYYNRSNTDNTFIKFNSPEVPVYALGVLADPYNLGYQGVWGRYRVAELLPMDYEPGDDIVNTPGQDLILAKLDSFSAVHSLEKAYLQFDKPHYAAGDTMYFKAYVTMGQKHLPSLVSGVLHVDLENTKSKIDRSIKLQLDSGVAWGDFALPDSLPKGNYRVRAWTQWMRNDPGSFFEKTIPVGSLQNGKVPESNTVKAVPGKPDVQFFPEGGTLVTDVRSSIAFKAVGPNGLGVNLKGEILDNNNKIIASFASVHLGMGRFELTPEPGKTYQAKLTFADGTIQTIALPKAEEQGVTLSVNNDSIPLAKVRITVNDAYFNENKGKNHTLLIYSGGTATSVDLSLDSAITILDILKRRLFTGVTTITLFSPNNEPLCERLIFVQNYDQLSLNVTAGKAQYKPRENVNLKLTAKTRADSAATGHFSIAVTDESKVPGDENSETTILTDLLLTSDLKGYIEQPNYYFNRISDTTAKNLDLVMMTHGYRRFEWKEVLNNNQQPVAYQPEHGLSVSGTVKTALGKPVANGKVTLISYMGGPLIRQATDANGNFTFSNLAFKDTSKSVLSAINSKGGNFTFITLSKPQDGPPVIPQLSATIDTNRSLLPYLQNHKEQWDQYAKYGLPNGRLLKEVKIRAIKRKDDYPSSSILGPGHADQVLHADEIGKFGGMMASNLDGRLTGIGFMNAGRGDGGQAYVKSLHTGPMLIILDGVNMGGMGLNLINPQHIETIEVLRNVGSASIYGMDGGNGVIIITTKRGKGLDPKDIASKGVLPVNIPGFYRARLFYAPKYEHPNDNMNRKDLRSTIYWQPELETDKDGNATISFYNADGTGNYKVVVEGMDEKGNIGRQVFRYEVK